MAEQSSDNVRTFTVGEDDDGIRLDRWFKRHLPDVSFNLVSRWARTGQLRIDGKRAAPGDRLADRAGAARAAGRSRARRRARARGRSAIVEPLTEEEAEFVREMVLARGPRLVHAQQAAGPGDAGRDQDRPASRPAARRAGRREGPAAQAGPPARQGHQRRAAGRALGARGGAFRQGLFRPHRAQGLLGAGRRRAVGRRRADRRAARQAAGHRRREDACRRGERAARARPAIG